jgi:hypothetical protein
LTGHNCRLTSQLITDIGNPLVAIARFRKLFLTT